MKTISTILAIFLFVNVSVAQPAAEPAEKILKAAYAQAAQENKNVFVMFNASWCGWCRKLDAAINDDVCKKFFDDNYVSIHLAVDESKDKKHLENPGAQAFKKKHNGESAGVPFWLIMDKNGNLLGDSYMRAEGDSMDKTGENIGCPGNEEEVAYFVSLLKRTSSLTDDKLAVISQRFRKNMATDR